MTTFAVRCRVDAFVDYVAEVRANSAQEAAAKAAEQPEQFEWNREGAVEFDARVYFALDDDGYEIAESERGDF